MLFVLLFILKLCENPFHIVIGMGLQESADFLRSSLLKCLKNCLMFSEGLLWPPRQTEGERGRPSDLFYEREITLNHLPISGTLNEKIVKLIV